MSSSGGLPLAGSNGRSQGGMRACSFSWCPLAAWVLAAQNSHTLRPPHRRTRALRAAAPPMPRSATCLPGRACGTGCAQRCRSKVRGCSGAWGAAGLGCASAAAAYPWCAKRPALVTTARRQSLTSAPKLHPPSPAVQSGWKRGARTPRSSPTPSSWSARQRAATGSARSSCLKVGGALGWQGCKREVKPHAVRPCSS